MGKNKTKRHPNKIFHKGNLTERTSYIDVRKPTNENTEHELPRNNTCRKQLPHKGWGNKEKKLTLSEPKSSEVESYGAEFQSDMDGATLDC